VLALAAVGMGIAEIQYSADWWVLRVWCARIDFRFTFVAALLKCQAYSVPCGFRGFRWCDVPFLGDCHRFVVRQEGNPPLVYV